MTKENEMTRMNMTRLSAAIAALSTALLLSTGIGQAAENPQEELSSAVIMPDTARTVFQVQKNGKWGSITADGTEVVPLVYDSIVTYAEGYLIVQKGGRLGIIRTDGTQIVPTAYVNIKPPMDDIIVVRDEKDKVGAYDLSGALLLPAAYASIQPIGHGILCIGEEYDQYHLCRRDGSRLTDEMFYSVEPFSEGRAAVIRKKGEPYGYIDETGNMVIPPSYDRAEPFHEDRAAVNIDKKWGFIDRSGTMVIAPQFRKLGHPKGFHEGYALVMKGKKITYIDKTGKTPFKMQWSNVRAFYDGLAEVSHSRDTSTLANLGSAVTSCLTIAAGAPLYEDDGSIIDDGARHGYINTSGTEVIPATNDYTTMFKDDIALVKVHGQWGAVDRSGTYIVPPQYSKMHYFCDDLAAVYDGRKWGYVGRDGIMHIPPAYDEADDFHEGLTRVRAADDVLIIDKAGQIAFHLPAGLEFPWHFSAGIAPIIKDGKWGFIDRSGSIVVSPQYSEVLRYDVLWMMGSSM